MHLEHAVPSELTLPGLDSALLTAALGARLTLLWGSSAPTRTLLAMIALLAAQGDTVWVFDGGNRFDGYFIARLVRQLTHQPLEALGRVQLSRAFTCFQLAQLIEATPTRSPARPGPAPRGASPLFVLDLLSTFYDESIPLREGERLLALTITHLKRLAAARPVIVGAREPQTLVKERWCLLDRLQVAADSAWMLRAPERAGVEQPSLF